MSLLSFCAKEKKLFITLVKGSKEDFIQEGLMQWDFAVAERDSAQF